MAMWTVLALAMLCGFAMPFAYAPFDLFGLAFLALAVWLWLLLHYAQYAWRIGLSFGFGWFGLGGWWLADTLHIYGHIPYILALCAVAVLGLTLGLFMAFWAWLLMKLKRKTMDILWLFPCIGVLEEWLRSFVLTGFPWVALGNVLVNSTFSSWISVFGSYFSCFVLLLLVSAMVLCLDSKQRKVGVITLVLGLALFVFSPTLETNQGGTQGTMQEVALVQPNIPQNQKWDAQFVQNTMFRLLSLSQPHSDVDLIIWPEAAVPMYLSRAPAWDDWLYQNMATWQSSVAFGGIRLLENAQDGSRKAQNSMFLAENGKKERQFVGKHHLVPFGEYVPSWLPWLGKLVPDIGDFEPASDDGILWDDDVKLGILICYESIFAEEAASRLAAGAEVLIVVTNDAWYDQSPAAWQHLQASQVRALETGRYVLRAANTGITAIIQPNGMIQASLPWWQAGVLRGSYQRLTHQTLYQQWGDLPILSLMFLGLGIAVWRCRRGDIRQQGVTK
ncbi:MAG: apolipoprotein N-acyltransferase [Mariprofundaceae bacterium]|nr:apolipoprotein N-acyltransferase [Mariprofundaceae bacterium]